MKITPENDKPFRLHIGCHSGTMVSRDSTTEHYSTLEEAREAIRKSEEFYSQIGSYLWFATVYDKDNKRVHNVNGVSYTS